MKKSLLDIVMIRHPKDAMRGAASTSADYWLVPQAITFEAEFLATRDWLKSVGALLQLEIPEKFQPIPV